MARKLQDRLALANYKTKLGMGTMSFNVVEAHVDSRLRRKRQDSSVISSSDSSSSTGSEHQDFPGMLSSSPLTGPIFSDNIFGSDDFGGSRKRARFHPAFHEPTSKPISHKSKRAASMAAPSYNEGRHSWKSHYNLAESSPLQQRLHPDFRTANGPNVSFVSGASTIPNSPPFGPSSDDDRELPVHSFQFHSSSIHGSPPRTPPPTRPRGSRHRKSHAAGEEGADLLLLLANSPSPANPKARAHAFPPSTPPPNHAALPSSMMATPGGTNIFGGFSTPGQNFNFADYVNITPSPAQGMFGNHTPGLMRTPLAAKEARRKLNFDTLIPPSGSPIVSNVGRGSANTGLGMELGGELDGESDT